MKVWELRAFESQNPNMYEHVGMADNHHRHGSDEWQTTSLHVHYTITKEQRLRAKYSHLTTFSLKTYKVIQVKSQRKR